MPRNPEEIDPYAPPPRHKERSGPLVRVVLIAAMLGLAAWGYTEYSSQGGQSLVAEEQTQQIADAGPSINPDGSYSVTQTPETTAPAAAPSESPAPASAPTTAEPAPADTPAPSTTIGTPGR